MQIRTITAGVWLLATAIGCTDPDVWHGTVEVVDGAEIVWNGPQPLLPPESVTVRLLWTGPPGAFDPVTAVWETPSRIRATSGALYVLDRRAGQVIAMSWEGRELRRYGRLGDGPGELRNPADIVPMSPNLGIVDRGAIKIFDSTARYQVAQPLDARMILGLRPFGADEYLVSLPSGWHRLDSERVLSLLVPPWPRSVLLPEWGDRDCGQVSNTGPILFRVRCTQPVVQVVNDEGQLVREFGFEREPVPAGEAELDSAEAYYYREGLRSGAPAGFMRAVAATRREGSALIPRFLAVSGDGAFVAVREQQPIEFGDGPATIHVFTHRGVYLAALTFPQPWVDFAVVNWRLVALVRDQGTGLVGVSLYELVLPPGAIARADALLSHP